MTEKGKSVVPILQSICQWSDIFYKEDSKNEMTQCQKCMIITGKGKVMLIYTEGKEVVKGWLAIILAVNWVCRENVRSVCTKHSYEFINGIQYGTMKN